MSAWEGVQAEASRVGIAQAQATGRETVAALSQSKLALNGVALTLVGFFGVWGAFTLRLQPAIISGYLLLFGLMLLGFSMGMGNETLRKYFGFMYEPGGQLAFLLIAGNLAWTTGVLGVAAAAFANFTAYTSWQASGAEVFGAAAAPAWLLSAASQIGLGGGGRRGGGGGTGGSEYGGQVRMEDDTDEML